LLQIFNQLRKWLPILAIRYIPEFIIKAEQNEDAVLAVVSLEILPNELPLEGIL